MLNLLAAPAATVKDRAADNTVVVSPHHVSIAAGAGAADIISVAGYPTGRHHTLIKASEARLAIQSGASEVWVSLDETVADANAVLSELIAIREACPVRNRPAWASSCRRLWAQMRPMPPLPRLRLHSRPVISVSLCAVLPPWTARNPVPVTKT